MIKTLTAKELAIKILIVFATLVLIMSLCALAGSQKISLQKVFAGPGDTPGENTDYEILVRIRLPRIILAALVGAALACSGAVLQAILRNPLADPYILGVSSGAGLGVTISIITGLSWSFWSGPQLFAFIGALLTVWLVWAIGYFAGSLRTTSLLLAGVVVNAFFSSIIMFLTSIAKSDQVYSTIFWLMGNISEKEPWVLWSNAIIICGGIIVLYVIAQKLNILSFGEEQAKGLGVETARTKAVAFGCAALITAIAVSLSGLIGFVGLIIPHAIRLLFGSDHRQLIPLSAMIGGAFLVIADTIARTIVPPAQLPVGVITAIAGGPFFLVLLTKYNRKIGWSK